MHLTGFLYGLAFCLITLFTAGQDVVVDYSNPIGKGNPMVFGGTQPRRLSDDQWDVLQQQGFKFMRSQADLTLLVSCESPEAYRANKNDCSKPENWDWSNGIYGDDFVQRAADRNMAVCLVIKNARWNRYPIAPDDEETMPRDLEVWQDIVTKIINHYNGGITYIECFNEVDREPQFLMQGSGLSNKEGYKKVILAGINAVRQSNYPQTKIGGTAAAGFGFDELLWLLNDEKIKNNLGFVSFHDFDNPDYPHQKVNKLNNLLREYNLDIDIVRSSYTPEFGRNHPLSKPGTTQPEYVAPHIFGAFKDGLAAAGLWEIQNREGENDFRYWFDGEKTVSTALLYNLLSNEYKLGKGPSTIVDVTGLDFSKGFGAVNPDKEFMGAFVNRTEAKNDLRLTLKGTELKEHFRLRFNLIHEGKDSVYYSPIVNQNEQINLDLPGQSVLGFKIIPSENKK